MDALILNDDRNLGNFGFLIDNDTNEIVGAAPAFDNGHAFFSRPVERFAEGSPALYERWEDFPGLNRTHACGLLERLCDFQLKKDTRFNLPAATLRAASDFLAQRIEILRSHYAGRTTGGPVNPTFTGPAQVLELVRRMPGLRKPALAKLSGLNERTLKRYLQQLKADVIFKGPPKTGGYYVRSR